MNQLLPHPVDIHVGRKLRERRSMLGISQQKLGKSLGITFQQVQKYEKGTNRMSSSMLFESADILSVPVAYFFEGINSNRGKNKAANKNTLHEEKAGFESNQGLNKETLKLIRYYYSIREEGVRKKVLSLIKSLASGDGKDFNLL